MKGLMRVVIVTGIAAGLAMGFSGTVEARMPYKKQFEAMYPDVVKKEGKDGALTCNVCHESGEGKTKKDRNNYGKALSKILGDKEEKDVEKIKEGLKSTEKEKSAIADKTFGDLLKDGKLPASK
ncbi:MAG: hypothetical protein ACKV2Q_30655 [Planctomycetaceae bacterium]